MTQKIKTPDRIDVFGTKFSMVDLKTATKFLTENSFQEPGYVCFPSTGMISRAHKDRYLQTAFNNSLLTIIDGKFTEFYLRWKKQNNIKCISGYDLMDNLLKSKLSHFFYGCNNQTLVKLENNLKNKFPDANILGFKAPPIVSVSEVERCNKIKTDIDEINLLTPDVVWVGISSPKQDFLMYNFNKNLKNSIMIGVGAVFLYQAGVVSRGPKIFKTLAIRWLYRIIQEPKRILAKKPIRHLAYFIYLIIKHDILKK